MGTNTKPPLGSLAQTLLARVFSILRVIQIMNRLIRKTLIGCRSQDVVNAVYSTAKKSFDSPAIGSIIRKLDPFQLFEVYRLDPAPKGYPFQIGYRIFSGGQDAIVRFSTGWKMNELPIDPKGFKALQELALQNGVPFNEIE